MNAILFIGLQASGKSTFYLENFYKTHIRINLDMLKTRHRENIIFNSCLEAKQPIVIDNTNPTPKEREKYISKLKSNRFEVIAYFFDIDLSSCLKRNAKRQGKERIPEVGIKATLNKLEPPSFNEGFDRIFHINIEDRYLKVSEIKNEI